MNSGSFFDDKVLSINEAAKYQIEKEVIKQEVGVIKQH
jgi:hypothetical protein